MKLLGLGDNVCDLYLHTGMMYPGGQALNVAVNAAKLGAAAGFLGVFGTDMLARYVQKILTVEGVEFSRCRRFPGENGYAKVTLQGGERIFLGSNRGGVLQTHPICLDQDDLDYCSTFQIIHTSNNSFLDDQLPKLARLSALVSYDFSETWKDPERVRRVLPYIDIAFLSGSSLSREQADSLAQTLTGNGQPLVCITRGTESALVYDHLFCLAQAPRLVHAVDTMGAGDSFAACLLVKIGRALEREGLSCWKDTSFRRRLLQTALPAAADWSAETCMITGAFGHGTAIPEEIAQKEVSS